ncbi:MAG: hypothetical protein JWL59_971 [Chthoniobacteraceae bacterium]|nr:hypothetical protein [Chthoniobacteraceae bacterium]
MNEMANFFNRGGLVNMGKRLCSQSFSLEQCIEFAATAIPHVLIPPMKRLLTLFTLLISMHAAAHAAQPRVSNKPAFDPLRFFTGQTHSWGVMESRSGEPTQWIKTETQGRMINGELRMEQELVFEKGQRQHRSWRMRRIDSRHFEATANDIIGTAHGELNGNLFRWTFKLALKPSNPLFNVTMTQRMYFQPDGKTMINRDTIRKAGIILAQVTEQFSRVP